MFHRILVANRGEIAVRIIRTCREMNIETVAVYSGADGDAMHVKTATAAVCIGPAPASDSYLNRERIISAAIVTGCEAIHPGFGFLSESSEFAAMCEKNGIVFIGPRAEVIGKLGNKSEARKCVSACGVPVVPGSKAPVKNAADACAAAEAAGYPVLIKAAAGGGGRGIRQADNSDELGKLFDEARAEAAACFGNDEMYIEKYIKKPRHIEIQILADEFGNIVQLGERDCSIQRKHQKLMEESPAMRISGETRKELGRAAVKAAGAAGYTNAGTVEFIMDESGRFYFIEMNTRIQVEHPVTEMQTGIDIVKEQIRIAAHMELSFGQEDVRAEGHTIECRINAEDPYKGFLPCVGKIGFVHFPGGPGVRVDTAIYNEYSVPPFYDSLLAKLIVHAGTRLDAIRKMRRALEELTIEGVATTGDFEYLVLHHKDYISGRYSVDFMEEHAEELLKIGEQVENEKSAG